MIDQANKLRDMVKSRADVATPAPAVKKPLNARVITITSGKGGVGKTNFVVNLAIQLRKYNKRVVIIDADFGLANIEVLFGIIPKHNLSDVLFGSKSISEVLTTGPMDLKFLSGGSGFSELANLTEAQMASITDNFDHLDAISDIILIDTGAGISKTVINFIKASNETILITTPEPTSITDAYTILKVVKEDKGNLPDFKIIVNRVDDYREGMDIFNKLNTVSEKFLNIHLQNLGTIPYDNHLVKAVKLQKPVSMAFPNAESTKSIENICLKILNSEVKQQEGHVGMLSFMKKLVGVFRS